VFTFYENIFFCAFAATPHQKRTLFAYCPLEIEHFFSPEFHSISSFLLIFAAHSDTHAPSKLFRIFALHFCRFVDTLVTLINNLFS